MSTFDLYLNRLAKLAFVALVPLLFVGATNNMPADKGKCSYFYPTADTDDYYVNVGGGCMTFTTDADTLGSGTGWVMQTEHCSGQVYNSNSCVTKGFDTNNDGQPDQSIWTGLLGARGIDVPWCGAGGIRFNTTNPPDAGEKPEIGVCIIP